MALNWGSSTLSTSDRDARSAPENGFAFSVCAVAGFDTEVSSRLSLAERFIGHALGWGIVGVTGTSSGVLGGTWVHWAAERLAALQVEHLSAQVPESLLVPVGAHLGSAGVGSGRASSSKGAATITLFS